MTAEREVDRQTMPESDYPDETVERGYVKWFDDRKNYGFIRRDDGSDLFVHASNIKREPQTLAEHERVENKALPGKKGPEARDVLVLSETETPTGSEGR